MANNRPKPEEVATNTTRPLDLERLLRKTIKSPDEGKSIAPVFGRRS